MPIPQPVTVEWAPADTPLDPTPTWETLGRPFDLTVETGNGSSFDAQAQPKPAKMTARIRNGADGFEAATVPLAGFHRWRQVRVLADTGSGPVPVFAGYVDDVEHDLADQPHAARATVTAVDALGVWNRRNIEDTVVDPDAGFVGIDGWTVTDLLAEAAADTGYGTPDISGAAAAPVTFPATVKPENGVDVARFSQNALTAIAKALDVELGTFHVGPDSALVVNGRYAAALATTTPALVLTDSATPGEWPYQRGTLKLASAYRQWKTGAAATGLRKVTVTAAPTAAVPAGYPEDLVTQTDLWTGDDNWVAANAQLLADLFAGITEAWPSEVRVVLWDTAMDDFTVADAVLAAVPGRTCITVRATLPGVATASWFATIEGVTHSVNAAQWTATLKLSPAAERWANAYDLSVGIVTIDGGAGLGIDSGAIIGP